MTQDKRHELAALVASKVYFHLQEYKDSLDHALEAKDLFDVKGKTDYVKTVVNKGLEEYIEIRKKQARGEMADQMDARLEKMIEGVFKRSIESKEYKSIIGFAIESQRYDVLEEVLKDAGEKAPELVRYIQEECLEYVDTVEVLETLYELMIRKQLAMENVNYEKVCQCLVAINNKEKCAAILLELANSSEKGELMAYQIGFELEENATQDFTRGLIELLGKEGENEKISKLVNILSGEARRKLWLEMLFSNNNADLGQLKEISTHLDSRNSAYHSCLSICNAYMHAGTTVDEFLRKNLEWLSRANNWSKFTATAALGVIHKGQTDRGMDLMQPYLPQDRVSSSAYSESGAFFALGLINAKTTNEEVISYLQDALTHYQTKDQEVLQHGACLGLGTVAMGSQHGELYESLKSVLYSDSAIAGEAAGLAMGMVMLGSGSEQAIEDILHYAKETKHEKIIRGLAIGISLVMFGTRDTAERLIEELCNDEDPLLRYAGVLTVSTAYTATGSNTAISRLLHMAVSDVNDDVRRNATIGLGYVLLNSPDQIPSMVQLLSASYNPHVRYGAALALGIGLASSGSPEAIEIVEPMLRDSADYVRQGALLAMSLVLMQATEATNPKAAQFRTKLTQVISNKNEDVSTKVGAVIAQGILDAGGRNVSIRLLTSSSTPNVQSCVGLLLMTQFWSWFPYAHFLPLAFSPTAIIAVDKNLDLPNLYLDSSAKPSLFAYPPPFKPAVSVASKSSAPVALSFTKSKPKTSLSASTKPASPKPETPKPKKQTQPSSPSAPNRVSNLSRVLPAQEPYLSWPTDARYSPVKSGSLSGIVLLVDNSPDSPVDLIPSALVQAANEADAAAKSAAASESANNSDDANVGPPPEPFQYPFGRD
ncbi:26S proteasome non-ATPase regulatory subunit 1 [Zancudomyces culisetae]|nr:26S proteasome non-ATPase regulatory subunit 1 [Zancudomyces culisetae]|eukprot:OMH78592.1 26S proteasome non-ATPase regulatory subunit 1 [Zancudomyces culisetae]